MEVSIQTNHLKAAACCAAQQDIRYYLNGVLIEVRATETRIVATDSNMAAVLRDTVLAGEQPVFPDVIVPNEVVKQVLASKSPTLSLIFDEKAKVWSLGGMTFKPIDQAYPDYRRIIPREHSGEAAQFNVDFLGAFKKIGKALGVKSQPIIRHNGNGAAQVQFYGRDDEFVGVIMPLRAFTGERPDTGLVQWGAERAK